MTIHYKIGLVIPFFNRPEELLKTLAYLRESELPSDILIVFIDDNSSDQKAVHAVNDFFINGTTVIRIKNRFRHGIARNLRMGIDLCFMRGCDTVVNLDSDALVSKDWLKRLIQIKTRYPEHIITGFHTSTKDRTGRQRHQIIRVEDGCCLKRSAGGINYLVDKLTYHSILLPALERSASEGGNFDIIASAIAMNIGRPMVCLVPSAIQHIGIQSTLGHHDSPDIAEDWIDSNAPALKPRTGVYQKSTNRRSVFQQAFNRT